MKIYDCFIYFDEDLLLDVRLNILDQYVDKFVIVESKFSHSGELRKPTFNINKFKKFEKKIEYILLDKNPSNLFEIEKNDKSRNEKIIINGNLREFYQRNAILRGLKSAEENDLILVSDVDEIPFLENIDFNEVQNNLVFFNQIFCCYKFNLFSKMRWCGSRMIKKKNLLSPQWLRDVKDRNYPFWRIDTLFSRKKYNNIKFVENGGWHFSYLKKPKGVVNKLKSIRHHIEYDLNPLGESKIQNLIENRKLIYNYKADQRNSNKFENNETLNILKIKRLPKFIQKNISQYSDWLE
jgi:beta-1,4-mannosyl-glycoprotein beta-1,4-N-acetylglucosaminyltransferase